MKQGALSRQVGFAIPKKWQFHIFQESLKQVWIWSLGDPEREYEKPRWEFATSIPGKKS